MGVDATVVWQLGFFSLVVAATMVAIHERHLDDLLLGVAILTAGTAVVAIAFWSRFGPLALTGLIAACAAYGAHGIVADYRKGPRP